MAAAAVGLNERREQYARRIEQESRARAGASGVVVRRPDQDVQSDRRDRRTEAGRGRRPRIDDRRGLCPGRAVEQVDGPGAGARGIIGGRADDQVVADPRNGRPEPGAGLCVGVRDLQEQVAEIRLGCVALELVGLAHAAILAGRSDHDSGVGRADRGAEMGIVQGAGVRDRQGCQHVAEGRALVIGVEHVRHAVAWPGERAAGRPDHQVVADHRERCAELIAGLGIGVGEDVDERAVCVGCD